MEGVQEVAEAFVQHYYAAFDGDRSMLQALYSEESLVSFEGKQAEGLENILTVVGSLQFQQVNRVLTTTDVQPVIVGGELMGILISILGQLQVRAASCTPCLAHNPTRGGRGGLSWNPSFSILGHPLPFHSASLLIAFVPCLGLMPNVTGPPEPLLPRH